MAHDLSVEALTANDLADVEALRATSNDTLGFMALSVMEGYLEKGGGVGIRAGVGLRGYALYAVQRRHVRLIHLCVADQFRRSGYAEQLLDAVVRAAKDRRVGTVKLTCRRDYEAANALWRRHGFVPLAETRAKTDGARLMIWHLGIDGAAQQDIFSSVTSDDKVKAAIDAQLFFDLPASGLQADFLADPLDLYITKEMFNEIDRAEQDQRERSRSKALAFPQLNHDADRMTAVVKRLERILPAGRPSEESDIRQLAMTATSDVSIFLTRDEGILNKAAQIKRVASVDVMHPEELIVRLDQFIYGDAYQSVAVSGWSIRWRRIGDDEVAGFRSRDDLLGPHERKRRFKGQLDKALSHPEIWRTEALWSDDRLLALRSMRRDGGRLIACLCRASRGGTQGMLTEYVAASLIHEAVSRGCCTVEVEPDGTTPEARIELKRLGFTDVEGTLVRMCPAAVMSAADLRKAAAAVYDGTGLEELERRCSPVALQDGHTECLLVPIKPGYARALFDTRRAGNDLFGADEKVLLRWENVYFRKKSQHRMIRAPAWILWYESNGQGIIAVSHLDGVEVGQPKDVFRNNRSLGTLGWREIREMCGGGRVQGVQDVMALQFSHTHLFRSPVSFAALRSVYRSYNLKNPVVQSPSRVSRAAFLDIFRLGFPMQAPA